MGLSETGDLVIMQILGSGVHPGGGDSISLADPLETIGGSV